MGTYEHPRRVPAPRIPSEAYRLPALRLLRSFEVGSRAFSVGTRGLQTSLSTLIDSFEHQNVTGNGWTTSGQDNWTYTNNLVTDGAVGLELAGNLSENLSSDPGDGLNAYPSQGDEILYDWETTLTPGGGSGVHFFMFGVDASDNKYRVDMDIANDNVELWNLAASNTRLAVAFDVGLSANTHYEVSIPWDDGATFGGSAGDIDVTVRDVAADSQVTSISGSNNDRSSGGIELQHTPESAGDRINTDWLRIAG